MTALTKTLELKLVQPNAHKRRKLRETRAAYQQALHDAFESDAFTVDFEADYESGYLTITVGRVEDP